MVVFVEPDQYCNRGFLCDADIDDRSVMVRISGSLVAEWDIPEALWQPNGLRRLVGPIRLTICGRSGWYSAYVDEMIECLRIGNIAMTDLDLVVDPHTCNLRPRDPDMIHYEI